MGIQIPIMVPLFTIDSDSFSPTAELVVLVCSQCSTTRHSACLWRCISHLVFGIQPVDSLMFSWHTECHQTLAAKTKVIWPFPLSKSAVQYVCGSEWAPTCECVFPMGCRASGRLSAVCTCMRLFREEPRQIKPGCWGLSVAVCHLPWWHADPAVLPVVQTARDLSRCETGVSAWLVVLLCSCLWGVSIDGAKNLWREHPNTLVCNNFSHQLYTFEPGHISPVRVCMTPSVYVWICLHSAVGEPRGRRSGTSRGHQRGAERTLGPKQWLLVSGLAAPEPGPDESQCHQWDHEHREALYQTP